MKDNFWKGFALSVFGFILWIFFGVAGSSTLTVLSFILMLLGPTLFWVVLPLKNKWYDKGKTKQFYLVITPMILLFLLVLASAFSNSDTTTKKTSGMTTQTTRVKILAPNKVLLEWRDNPVAAKSKYKDKVFAVRGKIGYILDGFGKPAVVIESFVYGEKKPWADTLCYFTDSKELLSLHKGDYITVVGMFDYCMEAASRIYLKDCHIHRPKK